MSLEALVADVTLVHLLVLVEGEDVTLQGVRPGVGLVTQVALVVLQGIFNYLITNYELSNQSFS